MSCLTRRYCRPPSTDLPGRIWTDSCLPLRVSMPFGAGERVSYTKEPVIWLVMIFGCL